MALHYSDRDSIGKKNYFTEKLIGLNPRANPQTAPNQVSLTLQSPDSENLGTTLKDSYLADLASGTYHHADQPTDPTVPIADTQNYLYTNDSARKFSERIEPKQFSLGNKELLQDGPEMKISGRLRPQERVLKSMEVLRPSKKDFGLQNHVSFKYLKKTGEEVRHSMRRQPSDLEKMLMEAGPKKATDVSTQPAEKNVFADQQFLKRQITPAFKESKQFDNFKNTEQEMLTKLLGDMGVQTNQNIVHVIVENAGKQKSDFRNKQRMARTMNPDVHRERPVETHRPTTDPGSLRAGERTQGIHHSLQMKSIDPDLRLKTTRNTEIAVSSNNRMTVNARDSSESKPKAWGQFSALSRFMKNYEIKRAQRESETTPNRAQGNHPAQTDQTGEGLKKSISQPSFARASENIFGKEDVIDGRMEINTPAMPRGKSLGRTFQTQNPGLTLNASRKQINLTKLKKRLQRGSDQELGVQNQQARDYNPQFSRSGRYSNESGLKISNQNNSHQMRVGSQKNDLRGIPYGQGYSQVEMRPVNPGAANYLYVPVQPLAAQNGIRYTFSNIGHPNYMVRLGQNPVHIGGRMNGPSQTSIQAQTLQHPGYQIRHNIYEQQPHGVSTSSYMAPKQPGFNPHLQGATFKQIPGGNEQIPQPHSAMMPFHQNRVTYDNTFIPNVSHRISENVVMATPKSPVETDLVNRSTKFFPRSINRQFSPFVKKRLQNNNTERAMGKESAIRLANLKRPKAPITESSHTLPRSILPLSDSDQLHLLIQLFETIISFSLKIESRKLDLENPALSKCIFQIYDLKQKDFLSLYEFSNICGYFRVKHKSYSSVYKLMSYLTRYRLESFSQVIAASNNADNLLKGLSYHRRNKNKYYLLPPDFISLLKPSRSSISQTLNHIFTKDQKVSNFSMDQISNTDFATISSILELTIEKIGKISGLVNALKDGDAKAIFEQISRYNVGDAHGYFVSRNLLSDKETLESFHEEDRETLYDNYNFNKQGMNRMGSYLDSEIRQSCSRGKNTITGSALLKFLHQNQVKFRNKDLRFIEDDLGFVDGNMNFQDFKQFLFLHVWSC